MSVMMQARSSTTSALVTWLMASPDWAGTSFPGPGVAQDVAVAAVEDLSTVPAAEATAPLDNASTGAIDNAPSAAAGLPVSSIRFTGAAPTLNGIDAPTSGRRLQVFAVNGPLVLANEAASAAAAKRITGLGGSVTIPQGFAAWLLYDGTAARWRLATDGGIVIVAGVLTVPATEVRTTPADGKSIDHDYPLPSVLTTDATATTLFTFATTAGRRYYLSGFIEGLTGSGAGTWAYELKGVFDNVAGTLTQRVATPVNELYETTTTATLTVVASGTSIAVSIVGVAATSIRWSGRIFLHEALF